MVKGGLEQAELWARRLLLPLALLAVVPVVLIELGLTPGHDLVSPAIPDTIYLGHAARGLLLGHTPYQLGFLTSPDAQTPFVYPPLSLLLAVPAALVPGPMPYSLRFTLSMVVLLAVGVWCLAGAARPQGRGPLALLLVTALVAMGPVLLTRVDALQGLVLAGAALSLQRRRVWLAVVLVTLAVLAKETVAVALVPVALWVWFGDSAADGDPLPQRLRSAGLGLLPAVVVLVGFLAWSRGGLLSSFANNLHRGVEIESLPGTVALVLRPIWPVRVGMGSLGSVQVSGQEVGWVALAFALAGLATLVAGSVILVRQRRPIAALTLAMAVGLAASPVLSPQYLLALVPLLVLAAVLEMPAQRGLWLLLLVLCLGLLTQIEFPDLFTPLTKGAPDAVAVVALRNLLLLLLVPLLLRSRSPAQRPKELPIPAALASAPR